ncbi:MAG: hypothetical protein GX033_00860, partial [Firmicutes bacterium]|nr:hypothetical protein [Bacillota bacterium]
MKRIFALLLCGLLVVSLVNEIGEVRAEEPPPPLQVTGYSVQGVLGVANTYAVTLHFKWNRTDLKSFTIAIDGESSSFKHVTGSHTIVSGPIDASTSTISSLNKGGNPSQRLYFLQTGDNSRLPLKLNYVYGDDKQDEYKTEILVIKSMPDPTPPPEPQPEPDPPPVDTTKYRPNLTVDTEAAIPLLDQETEELVIPIKNTAIYAANKITVSVEPADKNRPLFTTDRLTVSATINTLSRDQVKEAKFAVQLAPGATTGIHPITVNYIFHNNHGDRFTDSETAYIRVENRNGAPRLTATSSQWLIPGKPTPVKFKITNSGATPARNVQITLEGLDPAGTSVFNDGDIKYIDFIDGNGQAEVVYNLYPAPTLEGASTRLQIKLDYTDISGVTYSSTNTVFLPLDGPATVEDKGVPRLIISKYSLSPQEVRAGNNFLLELDLQNTSRSKTITNLKVTIISEEGVFLPVDASNTLFIESIAAGEVVPATLSLSAKADAENKTYPLRITFEYEDEQGNAYNAQEMITIPVHQNSRLVVGEVVLYGEPMLYDMVPVNVEFYNLGKTTLYNLMVQAEGPFQLEGGRYFVGNFNPGSSDSFNFAVIPNEPGEQIGAIVFQFEDSMGNPM